MKPFTLPNPSRQVPRCNTGLTLTLAALALIGGTLQARSESVRLEGAIVHTVSGASLTNQPVLIRDGRIAAVGPEAGAGAVDRRVDLTGLHLFPGLIAPGTILGLLEIDAVRATRDTTELGDYTPDVHSWIAVNPDSDLIPVARANGYAHAEVIPLGGVVSGQSAVIRLDGWTIEDLAVNRGAALHVFWPPFTLDVAPRQNAPGPDRGKPVEEQVRDREKRVRELDAFWAEASAYLAARRAAGVTNSAPLPTDAGAGRRVGVVQTNGFTVVPAWESMIPALTGAVPVVIHADEVRQIRSAVAWAKGKGLKMVLAGGRDAARVAPLLATNGIPVVFEHVFTEPTYETDGYDASYAAPARLHAAGVSVAFGEGTDRFGASNIRNIPYAAAQAVAFGLPRIEAWRGLTLHPARMLGMEARLGSIEAGKDATLIAVDGDILDIRANVRRMWLGGREVQLGTRHTRLYERYRNRPKP